MRVCGCVTEYELAERDNAPHQAHTETRQNTRARSTVATFDYQGPANLLRARIEALVGRQAMAGRRRQPDRISGQFVVPARRTSLVRHRITLWCEAGHRVFYTPDQASRAEAFQARDATSFLEAALAKLTSSPP